jgi:hypothetical protein
MPFRTGSGHLDPEHKNRVFEIDSTSRVARINAGVPHGRLDPGVVLDRAILPLAALIFTTR